MNEICQVQELIFQLMIAKLHIVAACARQIMKGMIFIFLFKKNGYQQIDSNEDLPLYTIVIEAGITKKEKYLGQ